MEKPIVWMGRSLKDLQAMPEDVKDAVGYALHLAQQGLQVPDATPMKGRLRGVMEIRVDDDGDTYRAMYTTRFEGVVYFLDVFQKKSRKGIKTPRADLDRILKRYQDAKVHYKQHGAPES